MKQRIITAVIALLALLLVLFHAPQEIALAVIILVMLAGAWEWSPFLGSSSFPVRAAYVAIIGALLAGATLMDIDPIRVFQVALVWWLAALGWTFFFPTAIPSVVRWAAGALVLVPLYLALIVLYKVLPNISTGG